VLALRSRPSDYRRNPYPRALLELMRRTRHPALAPLMVDLPDRCNAEAERLGSASDQSDQRQGHAHQIGKLVRTKTSAGQRIVGPSAGFSAVQPRLDGPAGRYAAADGSTGGSATEASAPTVSSSCHT